MQNRPIGDSTRAAPPSERVLLCLFESAFRELSDTAREEKAFGTVRKGLDRQLMAPLSTSQATLYGCVIFGSGTF